jgi:hypothetical protein
MRMIYKVSTYLDASIKSSGTAVSRIKIPSESLRIFKHMGATCETIGDDQMPTILKRSILADVCSDGEFDGSGTTVCLP